MNALDVLASPLADIIKAFYADPKNKESYEKWLSDTKEKESNNNGN